MHSYPFYVMQVNAKFGTGTVVGLNETHVEAKKFTLTLECKHFICTVVGLKGTLIEDKMHAF
jgi:hypothetical protein